MLDTSPMEFAFLSNSKVKYQRTQKGYNTPFAKNGSSYTKNIQFCLALSLYTVISSLSIFSIEEQKNKMQIILKLKLM